MIPVLAIKRAITVTVIALLCFGKESYAEELLRNHKDGKAIFTFSFENDVFSGQDANYTNGVRVAMLSAENKVPKWIEHTADSFPLFARDGHKRLGIAIGQCMYTPKNITTRHLQPNDRPYAGWLYGSAAVVSDTGYRLDNVQLTLGMIGPSSKAKQTQQNIHNWIDTRAPHGWDHQLKDELGVVLTYERKWRSLYEASPFGWGFDITPRISGDIGNVFTGVTVGTVFRFGYDLPSDYGPPLIQPSMAGSDFFVPSKKLGWYFFLGAEGRGVLRNIFLDGNTFKDSHHVDKYPLIGGFQGGIAFTLGETRLSYTHVIRSKEFEKQKDHQKFGAVTFSWRF